MAARGHDLRVYGESGGTSIKLREEEGRRYYLVKDYGNEFQLPSWRFGTRSFRSNVVIRREFRPGSTLYLVWHGASTTHRALAHSLALSGTWTVVILITESNALLLLPFPADGE